MNGIPEKPKQVERYRSLRTAGLFAGIGGIELGMRRHGHEVVILSEIAPKAQEVLKTRFPATELVGDIRGMSFLPECDLVSAGFPCQDLSQCGKTAGVDGAESSLVNEVFRLIDSAKQRPNWVLLENVPFMLRLDRGRAIRLITAELARHGYRWAYRTVNAKAFGVPQRRLRVVVLASLNDDPRDVIFADDEGEQSGVMSPSAFGFYWTEGNNGLGWAPDCVPTLKGGSTVGIPSPPAIWIPSDRRIATIDVRDAERLQGFPADWTKILVGKDQRAGDRWRFVGNAVCVHVASWIGSRLANPARMQCKSGLPLKANAGWPNAAYGDKGGAWEVHASTWPVARQQKPILEFLRFPLRPLSARATAGFLSRAKKSSLKFEVGFLADVANHLKLMKATADAAP